MFVPFARNLVGKNNSCQTNDLPARNRQREKKRGDKEKSAAKFSSSGREIVRSQIFFRSLSLKL